MEHEITERDGAVIVGFSGDVDLQSSPEARKILLECVARKILVLVDLSKVSYIDSSGIASLVESLQTARKRDGNLFLVSASEAALKVLELARLDRVFTICNSIDDAIEQAG
jgi:anti-sigma B factor antagonist